MNTLAFEEFESLDADYLAQVQGEGWIGAIAGGVTGALAGAKAGGAAGAVLGAGVGYNTPL
nr:Blp family class II bacteriocin [Streptococcus downei]